MSRTVRATGSVAVAASQRSIGDSSESSSASAPSCSVPTTLSYLHAGGAQFSDNGITGAAA